MYSVNIKTSGHVWDKKNLVTIVKGKKAYDEVECRYCGIKGKRYGFETVEIPERYNKTNVYQCPKKPAFEIPEKITITNCAAYGKQFANLTPGSIHDVIEPPSGYSNDEKGVWVMGVGEPVKVLWHEYKNFSI